MGKASKRAIKTRLHQKRTNTQNHLHFSSFQVFGCSSSEKRLKLTPSSFILQRKNKRHLVWYLIPVRKVYDSSRDDKMATSFLNQPFYFQKKKAFYFITSYRWSSSSQGKTFYIVFCFMYRNCLYGLALLCSYYCCFDNRAMVCLRY